jgi:hypothetical protein
MGGEFTFSANGGDIRNTYNILVGKSERKRPLGRSRHRWEHKVSTDLEEMV